jgi:hypothetical protein
LFLISFKSPIIINNFFDRLRKVQIKDISKIEPKPPKLGF